MSKFFHPLMHNNFSSSDITSVKNFLNKSKILTSNKKVKEFEKKWSKWQGIKYSVFVNSGSSANLLSIAYLKTIFKSGEIIVPTLTWSSDVSSVINSGFKPVFVDIDLKNLGAIENEIIKKINKKTIAVFLTHVLGFNCLSSKLIKYLKSKKIILIEDCCESHGAKFNKKKVGNFGLMSNFSFYYAHHMTTIEGGMVCTNDKKVYEIIRMLRGHGLVREASLKSTRDKFFKKYKDLNDQFIFSLPGYNVRSTEINAVIGINQLKSLNLNISKRNKNFTFFLKNLDKDKYLTDFNLYGMSNYALIIIFNKKYRKIKFRNKFEKMLTTKKIEFRRGMAGGGNQLRQPYVRDYFKNKRHNMKFYKNSEIVHFYSYYIGNFPSLAEKKIKSICKILNDVN